MNTRQGILVTLFSTSLFINFASQLWSMWSVATLSFFMLMITDLIFFEVLLRTLTAGTRCYHMFRCPPYRLAQLDCPRLLSDTPDTASCACASQDNEFWM